jgi:cysteine-rich repeat protein
MLKKSVSHRIFSKNKKGISAIIATLIIILLIIVVGGIIWIVIRDIIQSGAEQIELAEKCRTLEFNNIKVSGSGGGTYTITFTRTGAGTEDPVAGLKITLHNETHNSEILDFDEEFERLKTRSKQLETGIINATQMKYTAYFLSDSGEEQICETTNTFTAIGEGGGGEEDGEQAPYCGDGNLDAGEECDDGNTEDGDGCSSDCQIEGGGGGEEEPYCGDGNLDPGEECDDGNTEDGDGCSSDCQIEEPSIQCNGEWNQTAYEEGAYECDGEEVHGCDFYLCLCETGFEPNGDGTCELNPPVNEGIINSVWNDIFFDSDDLPKDYSVSDYIGMYVNFSDSEEFSCFLINFADYIGENDMSYIRIDDSPPAGMPNINSGEGYHIWEAEDCGQ